MGTLAKVIEDHATTKPDELAFVAGDYRLTWSAYAARSDALAGLLLDLDLASGERVAVILPDGPGVHVAFVATEKAGLVSVGIGPRAGRKEIEHLLRVTGASALISRPMYREFDMAALVGDLRGVGVGLRHHVTIDGELEPGDTIEINGQPGALPRRHPALANQIEARRLGKEDLWLINSTSGTTGMPKCVMHHQARWFSFHELAAHSGELSVNDVFLSAVPAPFGFGLWTSHFTPAILGAPAVVMPRFTPEETLAAIEAHRVTVLAAVSTQFMMLLDSPEADRRDLSRLRALYTGGEKVPYARAAEFEERTGADVLQFYGSNETGALCGTTTRDTREKRLTTAGRVIEDMQVRLFDESGNDVTGTGRGQPGCKGGTLSLGYYADDEANRELIRDDGWFLVGDVVRIDDEGYLTVEGRVGDFIIRGGKNISAPAVEEAVEEHPSVRLAAAVAMPDPTFGERVCVYVELRFAAELSLNDLVAHLEAQGASKESLPERLVVLDELPRSSGGKIAKKALRDDAARRAGQRGRATFPAIHPVTASGFAGANQGATMSEDRVRLSYEGPVAIITNDNQDKHNAFDDSMDARLFEILAELRDNPDVRVAIWRAEGKSFSSGRDVSQIGRQQMEMSHHQLMTRGHRGIQQVFELDIPILVANHGWTIGGSFQRTLLCDVRIAAEGSRFMLPELTHGVIADTGGVACLFQMCGHGVVSDMVLTGRPMSADEALRHGVISRIVAREELDSTVREMAEKIAASPPISVKLARRVIRNLHEPEVRVSMNDELLMQTVINKAPDFEEFKTARGEQRAPSFPGVWVKPPAPTQKD